MWPTKEFMLLVHEDAHAGMQELHVEPYPEV